LCTSRALHEGWVREGTAPELETGESGGDRRRSLRNRLRARRESAVGSGASAGAEGELDHAWGESSRRTRDPAREPRHVRAVPTSVEHKVASAVELFNASEHRRTVAGVARSLGVPAVSVRPSEARGSVVNVVVSWELCWYRYEVDLSDDQPSVRVAAQGYELSDLPPEELQGNAAADDRGTLALAD
jgi:hypothetical protein